MSSHDSQTDSANAHHESWLSLHASYESSYGQHVHYRFRYIVKRLLDSEASQRYTVGEAFLIAYHGEERDLRKKSLDELYADYAFANQPAPSAGRGLYFTTGPYGVGLHEVPHVVVYLGDYGANLYARYCRGLDVVSTNICQTRKEIPCILSLLKLLNDESGR